MFGMPNHGQTGSADWPTLANALILVDVCEGIAPAREQRKTRLNVRHAERFVQVVQATSRNHLRRPRRPHEDTQFSARLAVIVVRHAEHQSAAISRSSDGFVAGGVRHAEHRGAIPFCRLRMGPMLTVVHRADGSRLRVKAASAEGLAVVGLDYQARNQPVGVRHAEQRTSRIHGPVCDS
jgi:hypothetical protein